MTAYLIPIKTLSAPALAAVRFALEFGKRNGGTFYFLFVEDSGSNRPQPVPIDTAGPPKPRSADGQDPGRQAVESQIAQARIDAGLQVESVCRQGDFLQEVRRFVRDHHVAEIILGVPDELSDRRTQAHPDALLLHQLTHCRILTVKPKAKEQDPLWSPLH